MEIGQNNTVGVNNYARALAAGLVVGRVFGIQADHSWCHFHDAIVIAEGRWALAFSYLSCIVTFLNEVLV